MKRLDLRRLILAAFFHCLGMILPSPLPALHLGACSCQSYPGLAVRILLWAGLRPDCGQSCPCSQLPFRDAAPFSQQHWP